MPCATSLTCTKFFPLWGTMYTLAKPCNIILPELGFTSQGPIMKVGLTTTAFRPGLLLPQQLVLRHHLAVDIPRTNSPRANGVCSVPGFSFGPAPKTAAVLTYTTRLLPWLRAAWIITFVESTLILLKIAKSRGRTLVVDAACTTASQSRRAL